MSPPGAKTEEVAAEEARRQARVLLSVLEDLQADRKRLDAEIEQRRHAEERSRATIEAAPMAMVMIDISGRITLVNAETEKLFGYARDELLERSVEELLPERYRPQHPAQREGYFASPQPRRMGAGRDLFGRRKDGSEFPVEIGLNPVETAEGTFVLGAIVDISQRKELERAQQRLNEELEQRVQQRTLELELARDAAQAANRAKSQFLANMSHEIRTPLNSVIGLTELVLDSPLGDEQRDRLATVMDSAETLLSVLNDILDFSKIEAGKLALEDVPFRPHDLVADTLRPLLPRAERKGIELAHVVSPEVPPVLRGDPGRLRQVLTNLVQNAIKFTERGGVEVRVESEAEGPHARLFFSVRDTGIGVAAADLDRLFRPFEQVDTSTTRRFGGTGLGLAICRQLVALMNGRIGAESTPGEGSTFHFTARFGRDEADAVVRDAASTRLAGAPAPARLPPLDILLVDDSIANRKVAMAILEGQGHRLTEAEDGQRALERLEEGRFDVVLMDVQMPVMDGLSAAAAIRAREDGSGSRIPIVAMTAHALQGDREKCLAAGMDDYVSKPVRRVELIGALARVMGHPGGAAPAS